jgi:hypothetical protein
MRIACWKTKATNTHSECVTLIALPLQKWLQERALMLRLYVHLPSCNVSERRLKRYILVAKCQF